MDDLEKLFSPSQWSTRCNAEEVIENHLRYVTKVSKSNETNIPCKLDVPYGDSENEKLNIFGTDLPGDSPIFIYIHGGYWQELCREISSYPVRPLYDEGIKVIIVGYDLCPNVSLSDICDEVNKALIFCLNYAKVNKSRQIIICGHSAGAHLAIQFIQNTFQRLSTEEKSLFQQVILISGVFDLTPLINTYVNEPLNLNYKTAYKLSPKFHDVNCESTKFWIFVGEHDSPVFKAQSRDFYLKLKNEGVPTELSVLRGRDHFDIVERLNCKDYEIVEIVIDSLK